MLQVGVLSDTHLSGPLPRFREMVETCFHDCSVILHAGDLTELAILEAFAGKEVHAVCGNMCGPSARKVLPNHKLVTLGNFTIGLAHGHGHGMDPEDRLLVEFGEADCIIYGHTHRAVCRQVGGVLLMNPGSFLGGGRFGAHGTYGVLEIGESIRGTIHEVPALL